MLQRFLTVDLFWKGVNKYFSYLKAGFNDFCIAMQVVYEKSSIKNLIPINIRKLMHSWMDQRYFPVLTAKQMDNGFLMLQMDNFLDLEFDQFYLLIAAMKNGEINNVHSFIWKYNRTSRITSSNITQLYPRVYYDLGLQGDDWIIVNVKQIGYYRVNYKNTNWQKIASYLNSHNYRKIDVLNRAQIIDDAFYFLMEGKLDLFVFLNLLKYLSRERDYVAWFPMLKIFEYISGYIPNRDSELIKGHFEEILRDALHFLKYKENPMEMDFTNTLRRELVKWECIFNSSSCTNYIYYNVVDENLWARKLRDVFTINFFEKVVPSEKEWIYCRGIIKVETSLIWKELLQMYLRDSSNRLLKYLACPESPKIIQEYINIIIFDSEVQQRIINKGRITFVDIFHSIVARHSKNTFILTNILENLHLFRPIHISMLVALVDITNHVYNKDLLYKISAYSNILPKDKKDILSRKIHLRRKQIVKLEYHFRKLK